MQRHVFDHDGKKARKPATTTVRANPVHTGAGKRLMSCNAPGINCVTTSIAAMSAVWVGPNIPAKCSMFPRTDMGTGRGAVPFIKSCL